MSVQLDAVDRGIVRALAHNAREATTQEMADQTDVSPSTVRNRIERLEREGVIQGYEPTIDYDAVGLSLQTMLVCTTREGDRRAQLAELADLAGITDLAATIVDRSAVYATLVAADAREVERRVEHVTDAGLSVEQVEILTATRRQPCNHPRLVGHEKDR